MSLGARLLQSSLLNFADHGVKFVAMFLLTPVLANQLGDHTYGVWLLIMAFFSYYTLLDLGMNLASVRFLAKAIGRSEGHANVPDIIATSRILFRKIGAISLGLTLVGVAFAGFFFESSATASLVRWVIAIYGASIALRFWLMVYPVVLKSHVRYGPIAASSVARTILQTALSLWVLHTGKGIVGLALVLGLCDIAQQLFLLIFARELMRGHDGRGGSHNAELAKEILTYSMTSFATRLAINLKDRIDPFVVGAVAGAPLVPIFSVGSRFLGFARDLINALFGGQFLAAFSTVEAGEGRERLKRDFLAALKLSAAVTAFFGAGLAIFGPAFIERWMGPAFSQSAEVLLVLVIPYCLFLAQYPGLGVMFSIDSHHVVAKIAWLGSALNLVLSIVLGLKYGLIGVVYATVVDLGLVYGLLFPWALCRALGIPLTRYLGVVIVGALIVLLPAGAYFAAIQDLITPDYFRIASLATGLGIIFVAVLKWGRFDKPGSRTPEEQSSG